MSQLIIDLTALAPGQGGGYQRYLENLFDGLRLALSRPAVTVLAQASAQDFVAAMVQGVAQRIDTVDAHSLPQRMLATSQYFRNTRAHDVALFPGNIRALGCKARAITVIHDLQYRALPQYWSWRVRVPKAALVRHSIGASNAVVAISAQTRREVEALAPDASHKLRVIDNPITVEGQSSFDETRLTNQELVQIESLRGRRFVVTPSTLHPHKNIGALVQALVQTGLANSEDCRFVFLGHYDASSWAYARPPAVAVLGYVSRALHAWVLHHAAGFVLPSVYEGFGMPYFECAARGKPCLHADLAITRDYFLPSGLTISQPYGQAQIAPALSRFVLQLQTASAPALLHRHDVSLYSPQYAAQQYLDLIRQIQQP